MKYLTTIVALALTTVAVAQEQVCNESPKVPCDAPSFKIDLVTDVDIYKFKNDSVVVFDPTIFYEVNDKFSLGFTLPFYNSGEIYSRYGTGLGDMEISGNYHLFAGKCDYIDSDNVWIDVGAGLGIPLDGMFSSDDVTFDLSATFGAEWDEYTVTYTADWLIVDNYTFLAPIGTFVSSDVYTGTVDFDYHLDANVDLGVNLTQYSADNNNLWVLSPTFTYKFSNDFVVSAAIGIPVVDDLQNRDAYTSFNFGLELKF